MTFQHKFSAVSVRFLFLGGQLGKSGNQGHTAGDYLGSAILHLFHLSLEIVQDTLKQYIQPLSPGIYYSCLSQNGEKGGGISYRFPCRFHVFFRNRKQNVV